MPGVTQRTNLGSSPRWAGDYLSGRENLMPYPAKLDAAQFTNKLGTLVKANGAAAAAATSITVDALPEALPLGAVLKFGAGEFAILTAPAAKGATSITVEALANGIEDNDEAYYNPTGRMFVPSGTLVGRTFAERDANTGFGPAIDTDDEIYLIAHDVEDAVLNPYIELVRVKCGFTVKENYLPDWATISADANLLADLRALYNCIKGKE